MKNEFFNDEHKEIIFKSFILPINEDMKISIGSTNIKSDFSLFSESMNYLLDVVIFMKKPEHLQKILYMIQENLVLD